MAIGSTRIPRTPCLMGFQHIHALDVQHERMAASEMSEYTKALQALESLRCTNCKGVGDSDLMTAPCAICKGSGFMQLTVVELITLYTLINTLLPIGMTAVHNKPE